MEISKEESSKNLWKNVEYYHEHVTIIDPITKSEEIKMSHMEGLEEGNPYVEDTHSITEHEENKVIYKKGLQEGLFVEYSHPIIKHEENKVIYMEDLEKRKEVYGICGECNEPGTGEKWCQPCNAKRLKENFKFWTSGNKIIDEFIQKSQLEATHYTNSDFPEGFINCWDIDNQKWDKITNKKWVLKSLGNNNLSSEFLNEVGSHLQIFIQNVIVCRGITQDPSTNNYMMVLDYCDRGDLKNLNKSELDYKEKINILVEIARGLLEIHNAGKVHKDFHSGNILFFSNERDIQSREDDSVFYYNIHAYISDLGLCRPVNDEKLSDEIRGIIPYMAPEVLRNQHPYTKAADIYSFGIIMNEFLSEEAPFYDSSYDHLLMVDICNGIRPRISKDIPKLFADLITRCWDPEIENRPTAKELFLILAKWQDNIMFDSLEDNKENNDNNNSTYYRNFRDALENFKINKVEDDKDDENGDDDKDDDYGDDEGDNKDREDIYLENIEETIDYDESDCVGFFSEIYNQIKECEKIRENKLKDKNELKNIKDSQETYNSSLTPKNSENYRLISDHYSDCKI
ncbi:kinase-like domain-containing protein [Rhizophagus diaphanus]|nr:kinase-like domain-containing protein [Rhizophagus diaphanus] [Rhizophagus sp. MUCL 43196]